MGQTHLQANILSVLKYLYVLMLTTINLMRIIN